eukprot:gnl/MRDRNA2_/MRDRNA2_131033_c0_seq1.p1 gnl/MRDRNA2_/MRDRNA2_131033_c0~~gnl/MRDRNA2_/MRDRNA2_131033_c0_seq1.p1  ORF type:complete len:159 (+),score=30.80 gnl/MRDRNA2_/MRDRNA2_131033_c0_seq1:2-478(+)
MSCLVSELNEAVDELPTPPLSMIQSDYTKMVQDAVSAPRDAQSAMEVAEVLLKANGDESGASTLASARKVVQPSKAFNNNLGRSNPPCSGTSCYTDPVMPPPLESNDVWSTGKLRFKPDSWKRATEWSNEWKDLASANKPLLDGASSADVRQGGLGDC